MTAPRISSSWLTPDWSVPGVTAFTTVRSGGVSHQPWDSLNLGDHVGDDPAAVAKNRSLLQSSLPAGAVIQWLEQVHGVSAVEATGGERLRADACWSVRPGVACAVMSADCLPVLLTSTSGRIVAAAHAGWRGLLGGVLENTVMEMKTYPGRLQAWLGPAIGPDAFEVGPEVREAFLAAGASSGAFIPGPRQDHYFANLCALARERLQGLGVSRISGGGVCTYQQRSQFFSYRRDGETGRMASLILINPR